MATKNIDFFQLQRDIDDNNIKSLYLLYGEESYLHNMVVENFKKYFNNKKESVNFEIFYGENINIENLVNSIKILPLGIEKQFVIIKNIEKINKNIVNVINNILSSDNLKDNSLTILLLSYNKKLPRNISLDIINKTGTVVSLKKPKSLQIKAWIKKKINKKRIKITDEAVYCFQQITDNDLGKINNEVEKLFCYLGNDFSEIKKEDIINSVYGSEEGNIFNLVDAIGERDIDKSLIALSKLTENNYHPLPLLAMIYRQMKLIMQAKLYKVNKKRMQEELHLPFFVINNLVNQSKKYEVNKLRDVFRHLLDAEIKLKTGYFNPVLVLEQLVVKIIK